MGSCKNCCNYVALDKNKYEYDSDNACCGGDDKYEACEYYEMAKEIVNTEEEIEKIYNADSIRILKKYEEAKRLLKLAMEDMNVLYESGKDEGCAGIKFKWRYADEVEKLLGEG